MPKINFNYNYKKAVQALNHYALKQGGSINKMKALKLIYLADRYHLRKYGRLITNDTYFVMEYGPVPSAVKDIAERSFILGEIESNYSKKYIAQVNKYYYKSREGVEIKVFSQSDIEALDIVWEKYGHYNEFELAELTHKYPEWKKHKRALDTSPRIQMALEDLFENLDKSIDDIIVLSEQEQEDRLEQLSEMRELEALWS